MNKPVESLIAVACGDERAGLVIKNARVWNAFTGEFVQGDVAVEEGYIAGVGSYRGKEEIDAANRYLVPGFIDAHVHIESSMAAPAEFALALARAGVTSVIADPHEIANVAGTKGLEYILDATENLPVRMYVMLPSCVPATPLEESATQLLASDLAPFLDHPRVLGLGEMMNFPGLLGRDPEVMRKVYMAQGYLLDGHAPGLEGNALTAYAAAGVRSDHECSTAEEARDRLRRGMALMLREGSATANLLSLLPAVTAENESWCMFCTDDRNPCDLLTRGSINDLVRMSLQAGQPLNRVLRMASLNAARHFGLRDLGAIAPGFRADMALYSELSEWWPEQVFKDGRPLLHAGKAVWAVPQAVPATEAALRNSVHLGGITPDKLDLPVAPAVPSVSFPQTARARVIGVLPGQILTEERHLSVPVTNGHFMPDPAQDILKLSVWERHKGTGLVGVGLVQGMGLTHGAIGSTVAHDSHHLIAVGASDEDILAVVKELSAIGGGLAVASGGRVIGTLPLPLGGLLSDKPLESTCRRHHELLEHVQNLGVPQGYDPFMTLAFLSLPVIPSLKLTCAGLVDVGQFAFVSVGLDE